MKAGVAELDITPPIGCVMVPFSPATGVHDPLMARALVLDDGETRVAIVSMDHICFTHALSAELTDGITAATDIEHVLLCCSHSHNTPFDIGIPTPAIDRRHAELRPIWRAKWREGLPQLVAEAAGKLAPATLKAGRAPVRIGFNRRLAHEDGNVYMDVNTDGAVVPWVDVLVVEDAAGAPMTILFEHAAHPVIVHGSSDLMSADYPGAAVAHLRSKLGDDVTPMFLQGCGANINGHPLLGGHEKAIEAGQKLGDAVLAAMESAETITADKLKVVDCWLRLPTQPLPPLAEVEQALAAREADLAEKLAAGEGAGFLEVQIDDLKALRNLVIAGEQPSPRFGMKLISLGTEWCLLAFASENVCEYQLWVDSRAPFARKMVTSCANGIECYVATEADLALGEHGGYEAGAWPGMACCVTWPQRVQYQPVIEKMIHDAAEQMWT